MTTIVSFFLANIVNVRNKSSYTLLNYFEFLNFSKFYLTKLIWKLFVMSHLVKTLKFFLIPKLSWHLGFYNPLDTPGCPKKKNAQNASRHFQEI